ncbi:MAG: hypothetical protein U1F35_03765 [Steroidobacteraceae bacterium]
MNELPAIALTSEEILRIFKSCNTQALLVGGQALAYWAMEFQIRPRGILQDGVTRDVDFIGSAAVAQTVFESLRPMGWRFWRATFDDAGSQTAKISKRIEGVGIKQIDFLTGIIGIDTEKIRKRAVSVRLADGTGIKVLHPIDVLESRLKNLASIPSKRDAQGIAQANLALEIAAAYLNSMLAREPRQLLNALKAVIRIAEDKSLDPVFHDYGIEPLSIVPAAQVPVDDFKDREWPLVLARIDRQRRAYGDRIAAR